MVLLMSLSSLVSLTWAQGHDVDFLLGGEDTVSDDVHHGSAQCAQCHPDITEQWAESSHRMSSFNNPYYAAAARVFIEDRGQSEFVFCARCHDPALLVNDPHLNTDIDEDKRAAQAGITCLVCHSMAQQPPAGGNGQYGLELAPVPMGNGHRTRVRPDSLSGHRVYNLS